MDAFLLIEKRKKVMSSCLFILKNANAQVVGSSEIEEGLPN